MAFYDEMAAMVADLLKPDTAGGLGQGQITLTRQTKGLPDPNNPGAPVAPVELSETVEHIGNLKAEYTTGGTVVVTDYAFMIVPPLTMAVAVGDKVSVDGRQIGHIVHIARLGSNDVTVYNRLYVNR